MYFFPDLFPRVAVRVLCCVQMRLHTLKQIWSLAWLNAAIKPRNIHSCKNHLSRGLFGFCFVLVLENFNYK